MWARRVAQLFNTSTGSISIRDVLIALYMWLNTCRDARIEWPSVENRKAMHDTITGFTHCVGFVNGTKIQRWRLGDKEQDKKYDGHHKFQ